MNSESHEAKGRIPILSALESHAAKRPISLHVPGHKFGAGLHPDFGAWIGPAARLDATELPGLDDLHHPQDAIREAQELAAEAFGAERTYFLVNGSTCGNYAMLMAACRPGETVLVARDCHISAIRGLALAGAKPVYLLPEPDASGYPAGISIDTLLEAIRAHPEAKALFLTSPSYRGACAPLRGLVDAAHAAGLAVLVDEAHGAHFGFHPALPASAMQCGADLAVQSTHKSLGALTQAAMLHAQGNRISAARLEEKLRIVQSTSPSYLLLASLDAARAQMQEFSLQQAGQALAHLQEGARQLLEQSCFSVCSGQAFAGRYDPMRWWVQTVPFATGFAAAEWLRTQRRIWVEFADPNGFLLIWGLADSRRTVSRVVNAVLELSSLFGEIPSEADSVRHGFWPRGLPEQALLPAHAQESETCLIPVGDLPGHVAGEAIVPYPPGIPVVLPGERWTAELRDAVAQYVQEGGQLQGAASPNFKYSLAVKS